MAQTLTPEKAIEILEAGEFEKLKGTIESGEIEFKGKLYQIAEDFGKRELAKDVSALANANGGVILIGFRTAKDDMTAVDCVDECRPFDLCSFDVKQHRDILNEWICPSVPFIEVRCFRGRLETDRGVAAIVVPPTAKQGKPYIVNRMVEADGKVRGTFFGYFERVQDQIPPTSAQALQGLLRDGLRFTDILDRLDWLQDSLGVASSLSAAEMLERLETIEAKLVKSTSVASPGPSDLDVSKRIAEAEEAVGRTSRANIIMAATSTTECTFPDLFRSRSAPIVKLLMDPPVLRQEGFAITPLGSAIPADIVQGKLRRVVWKGQKLAELWKDGCLVAIGPGDDDLLCWFTRSHRDPKPGLPIRSVVLAEVVLNFCNFAVQVFGYAEPAPQRLRFGLTLNNMTEDGVPCKLSTAPDNNSSFGFSYYAKEAPAATISVTSIMDFKNADPGVIAYQLLGSLYVEFGFEVDGTPYIQRDGDDNRITRQSLFNEPRS